MSEAKVTEASEALLSFLRDTLGSAPEQLFAGAPLRSHLDQVRGRIETAEAEMVEVVNRLLAEARVALLSPPSRSREIGADADEGGEAARGGGTDQDDELAEALRLPRGRVSELCRCCLAAAALVRGRGARLLVRRAREVLELFVALAPTRVSSPAAGAAAQRATHQLVRELALLRPQWCETLPRGVALSSVSRLAEAISAVLRPLYESLVALRHISERDSRALHKVLSFLLPACEQLLSAAARSPLDGRCEHLVPSLRRCRQLGRLLDARLAEVVAWWGEGELDAISARDLLVLLRAIWNEEALLANAREMHRALVAEAAL
ncbi:Centromere/kinetochore protein zw10 [Emiliania huxleyi CCMP1516]|uniref:ZW10 C-terminal helical domain-containing protein n=2 Tax=Emiliania huxleyi TaxID=2903 RepID=A0A0D3JBY1_EMIH1|nr:Centromere/kinetochore protein zw10 [Emiliania huxleyi CCMP1516]EOD21016.1 Centromere/kinetochore protein zw10 [Emiliania huxleyi CCMP1516]|eukprot:XP_005773445.1 Centromere/kinetochore protein zw10 [Emiliania huxleyi CCMP1516]